MSQLLQHAAEFPVTTFLCRQISRPCRSMPHWAPSPVMRSRSPDYEISITRSRREPVHIASTSTLHWAHVASSPRLVYAIGRLDQSHSCHCRFRCHHLHSISIADVGFGSNLWKQSACLFLENLNQFGLWAGKKGMKTWGDQSSRHSRCYLVWTLVVIVLQKGSRREGKRCLVWCTCPVLTATTHPSVP